MSGKQSQVMGELSKFMQAFWVELPAAAANKILGKGDEHALDKAGWKAYDAFVSLANEATNQLYQDKTVGSVTGQAMETALRVQHIGNALTSAFFGNLWPSIGLPTASEFASLRTEIAAVRAELADALAPVEIEEEPVERGYTLTDDGVRIFADGRGLKEEDDDDAAA
ncbi:MAG TPA: hypothetical protein VMT61_13565 [Candidatus Binataceae bacterium]|nr:hypothetical protein [Candidatus Binataceae bacterium]